MSIPLHPYTYTPVHQLYYTVPNSLLEASQTHDEADTTY